MDRVDLRIDRASELPLGVQLARRIRSHIDSGGLKPERIDVPQRR